MRVNASALLARKASVTSEFGHDAWKGLFSDMARAHTCLRAPLTISSFLPLSEFLAFHDELVRRLYAGDPTAYFRLGEKSAAWALSEGPYQNLFRRELEQLGYCFRRLWRLHFTETSSWCDATATPDGVQFSVFELPERHAYFSELVVGYVKGVLEQLCVNPIEATQLRERDGGYTYLLHPTPFFFRGDRTTLVPTAGAPETLRPKAVVGLTPREVQVLRLIGAGKGNRAISSRLGISPRTVQLHVSNLYGKLGLYSRAEAALWCAQHYAEMTDDA